MNHGDAPNFGVVEPKGIAGASNSDSHVTETATLDIGRKAVFAVVGSPLRMRIFEVIRRTGDCSVRELSAQSGLSTTGLYYHLQALEHLDLIRQVGVRTGDARRAPAVFAATCERIRILFNPDDATHRSRVATIRRRWNQESMGSVDESLEAVRGGGSGSLNALLEWENLTEKEVDEVRDLLLQVQDVCRRARLRGTIRPEGARPVHVSLQMCELATEVMPSPAMVPEAHRRPSPLGELVNRMDHARDRPRAATA